MDEELSRDIQPMPPPLPAEWGAPVQSVPPPRLRLHIFLFVITGLSTWSLGCGMGSQTDGGALAVALRGLSYAIPIMLILLCHESGHFLMCRKYGVPATLPYFIPMPFGPFGTMGAFIKMRGFIPSKKAIFDIGAAGPIAGFVVCLPCLVLGLMVSQTLSVSNAEAQGLITLGEPLLLKGLSMLVFGTLPEDTEVLLHPLAFAGWAGLFVTGLNLLPMGQLDGGHVLYGLLGRMANPLYKLGLVGCVCAAGLKYQSLLPLCFLLLLVGRNHPPALDQDEPIGWPRILVGLFLLVVLLISFTPAPFAAGMTE